MKSNNIVETHPLMIQFTGETNCWVWLQYILAFVAFTVILFQNLLCKIDTVHGHNTRYASKNMYFRLRVKKCITQNLLVFGGLKLRTNIDDVYKYKDFSTATFKKHYNNFLLSKY